MILRTPRVVYNKSGLGFKSNIQHKTYMSLTNRYISKKVKAPKPYLINKIGNKKLWIPKDQVYYIDKQHLSCDLGGGNNKLVSLI